MKRIVRFIIWGLNIILFLAIGNTTYAQEKLFDSNAYQFHFDQAKRYIQSSLFAEGITELNLAIASAQKNNEEQQYIEASIELAETLRKTTDFNRGAEILLSLGKNDAYPLLEVRRMGRIAAIYHESIAPEHQYDSVSKYLNPAIELATLHGFDIELAHLKNELGYLISKRDGWEKSLIYHYEAAEIFSKNGDLQNYIGVMTKVINLLINNTNESAKIDSILAVVLPQLEGREWYSAENELYQNIASYHLQYKADETAYYRWLLKANQSALNYGITINSSQLDNIRVLYETEQFQKNAQAATIALEKQKARNRDMALYLTILAFLLLTSATLFYRERKAKKAKDKGNQLLQVANEKYQLLMIESNHRIKNNLQMIISMLEYAGRDVNPENTRALKRMSSKIHTISALHKHLYSDMHNKKVDLAIYFKEIISLYTQLSADNLEVFNHFDAIHIPSERLVYFGLIFNEMLSNTMEHNSAEIKQVHISTTKNNDGFRFEYRDDSPHKATSVEGTGSLLIRQLVNRVNGQNFQFDPSIGQYQFQFDA